MRVAENLKKTIVVIGGSFAGLAFAKALHNNAAFDVLIIEKRSYCDINFASPRLLQDPSLARNVVREFREFKWLSGANIKLKQATVTALHADRVETSAGESFLFDFCVIASGIATLCRRSCLWA
jgi:NADH dehydrogenase FAD-containing subunit